MKQRKRTKRRILSVLLTLVMVFSTITGIVPGGVMTAKAETIITYIERAWDDSKSEVTVTEKKASCTTVTDSTTTFSNGGWYVVSEGETTVTSRITVSGTANLILCDGATLNANCGITVNQADTLNVYAQSGSTGKLVAKASTVFLPGIGGGSTTERSAGGTVNIHGGSITATGMGGPGIGGSYGGNGGTVTIYDGTVTATGQHGKQSVYSGGGAGIGGAVCEVSGGNYYSGNGGTVTIYGGKVNAQGSESVGGAGIGGAAAFANSYGDKEGCGGDVNIYGGEVTASGGQGSAGIGAGCFGNNGGTVTVYGGKVTANGYKYDGAGIGGGKKRQNTGGGTGATVTINGGTVIAQGGTSAAGIGGGGGYTNQGNLIELIRGGAGGNVTINGGIVIAHGSGNGKGIGGGTGNDSHGALTVKDSTKRVYGDDNIADPNTEILQTSGDYARYTHMSVRMPHKHSLTRKTGTGDTANVITVICANTDGYCNLPKDTDQNHTATLAIYAPTLTTYGQTGTGISADVQITDTHKIQGDATVNYFKATKDGDSYTKGDAIAPNVAPTNAGDYWAEITLGESDKAATAVIGYTIFKATESVDINNTATACEINYVTETATPQNGYEVSADGENAASSPLSLTAILDGTGDKKIYVRKPARDDNYITSDWVAVTLASRPDAPNVSAENANDTSHKGKIKGTSTAMEYKLKGDTGDWTTASATNTEVDEGIYQVRVKATSSAPAGQIKEVTVGFSYSFWVDGIEVTSVNKDDVLGDADGDDATVIYAPDTNTLTLNGANITAGYIYNITQDYNVNSGICYLGTEPLKIILSGENSIAVNPGTYDIVYGIFTSGNLTVDGTGSIDITAHYGIGNVGDININGSGGTQTIAVIGGKINIYPALSNSSPMCGLIAYNPGGSGDADISITGGEVNINKSGDKVFSYGMWGESVSITGGKVYAVGDRHGIIAKESDSTKKTVTIGVDGLNTFPSVTAVSTGSNSSDVAIYGDIYNYVPGRWWTNADGTTGKTSIVKNYNSSCDSSCKRIQFPAHDHDLTYAVGTDDNANVIIATCKNTDGYCDFTKDDNNNYTATLTIAAPEHAQYGDNKNADVKITDDNGIQGDAKVSYFKATKDGDNYTKGDALSPNAAPTNAGDYWAEITLGKDDNEKTAHVVYTIFKADCTTAATKPAQNEITKTDKTITIKPTKENQEYVIVKKTDPQTEPDWTKAKPHDATSGATFDELDPKTEYEVYTRVKEQDNTSAGTSVKVEVKTDLLHIGSVSITPATDITEGVTLTANIDPTNAGGTITYKWYSCNTANGTFTAINGATASTYMITPDEIGKYIKVEATQTAEEMNNIVKSAVTGIAVQGKTHEANELATVTGGSTAITPETQNTNDTITVTTSPEVGWKTTGVSVKEKGGDKIVTSTKDAFNDNKYTFIQPEYDVTITPQFEKCKYTIANPSEAMNGTVTLAGIDKLEGSMSDGNNTASVGDTVKLTVTPAIDYVIDTLTVSVNGQVETITPTKNDGYYEFTMPAANVTKVEGTFKQFIEMTDNTKPTIVNTSREQVNPQIDDVLQAQTTATPVTYQWYRGEDPIDDATSATYTVTFYDCDKTITVKVTQAKDSGGSGVPANDVTKASESTGAVEKKTAAELTNENAKANVTINYPAETATPNDSYEVSADKDSITAAASPLSLTSILDGTDTPTIYVRTKEIDDTKAGNWVTVTLTGRPNEPTGLTTANATNGGSADGKIKGTDTTMQYKLKGSTDDWTIAGATETVVKPGTYLVRVMATDSAPHSKETEVTVGSNYKKLTDKPTISVSDNHNPPIIGDVLTASSPADDVIYEWYRGTEKIPDATGETYTITAADAGNEIKVVAIQTKDENGVAYDADKQPQKTSDSTGSVEKKTPDPTNVDTAKDGITIDYTDEIVTPEEGYEVTTDKNSTEPSTPPVNLKDVLDGKGTPTIYVRTKETDENKAGEWVEVTLTGRPNEPTGLTTANATNGGSADGKIKGTDTTMQYKLKGSTDDWTIAGATETVVKPGTYLVRVMATDSAPHSKETEVTVGSNYKKLTDKPTISVSDNHNPPIIGDVLTASSPADDVIYEWYRGTEKIPDATGETYTITAADAGNEIKVVAIQTKDENGVAYDADKQPQKTSDSTGAVEKKTPVPTNADTAKEGIVINYHDEAATPKDGYEVTTDKDSAEPSTPPVSLTEILDGEETPTIYVRTKETDDTKAGEWVEVTLPARPDAPTGLNSESAASLKVNDGKLINTATTMEYKLKDSAEEWKAATDNETTGLAAGTYSVRYKATDADLHSKEATVTVGSKEIVLADGEKPTAKADITYTGEAQELLDAPKDGLSEDATGIQYAIGTDDKTEPVDGWGDSIPKETNAGIYYVWYKAIADSEHTDCIGGPIAVTIAPAEATVSNLPSASAITYGQKLSDSKLTGGDETGTFTWKAPETVPAVADSDKTEYEVIFTPKDTNYKAATCKVKVTVNKAAGKTPSADAVKTANASSVSASDGKLIFDGKNTYQYSADDGVTWTDVKDATSVSVKAGTYKIRIAGDENNEPGEPITVKVTVAIPETTKVPQSASVVTPEEEEKATLAMNEGLKISQTKSKINISWGKVDTAAGYDVYVQYCGSNFKKEPTAGTNKTDVTKVTVNKINGKELNLKKNYKIYIEAYKLVDGKKVSLAKTITGHIVGRKNTAYTNVKMIKLAKSKYTVKAGKTATIKAKTVLVDKRKKQLSNAHATQFRYASSDNKIATVSKKGKIKGIAKGQCSVYVYARNGYARKITVTVK